jgi:hypothetical protein
MNEGADKSRSNSAMKIPVTLELQFVENWKIQMRGIKGYCPISKRRTEKNNIIHNHVFALEPYNGFHLWFKTAQK